MGPPPVWIGRCLVLLDHSEEEIVEFGAVIEVLVLFVEGGTVVSGRLRDDVGKRDIDVRFVVGVLVSTVVGGVIVTARDPDLVEEGDVDSDDLVVEVPALSVNGDRVMLGTVCNVVRDPEDDLDFSALCPGLCPGLCPPLCPP